MSSMTRTMVTVSATAVLMTASLAAQPLDITDSGFREPLHLQANAICSLPIQSLRKIPNGRARPDDLPAQEPSSSSSSSSGKKSPRP